MTSRKINIPTVQIGNSGTCSLQTNLSHSMINVSFQSETWSKGIIVSYKRERLAGLTGISIDTYPN